MGHLAAVLAHFAVHHPWWAAGIVTALWMGWRLMRPAPMSGELACSHSGGWVAALVAVAAGAWWYVGGKHHPAAAPHPPPPVTHVIVKHVPASVLSGWQIVVIAVFVAGCVVAVVVNTRPRGE